MAAQLTEAQLQEIQEQLKQREQTLLAAEQLHERTVVQAEERASARRATEAKRNQLVKATRVCDGSSTKAVREWILDMELAANYFTEATRDGHLQHIVSCTLQGPMRRCYERFMNAQVNRDNVSWAAVRTHLRGAYLTQDEGEFLRTKLEKVKQSSYQTHVAYGREFEEVADQAYPTAERNTAIERHVLNLYIRGLRSHKVMTRLVQETEPDTLQEALKAVETFSAQEERCTRFIKGTPGSEDSNDMEVSVVEKDLEAEVDRLKRQITGMQREFTRLKAAEEGRTKSAPPQKSSSGNRQNRRGYTDTGEAICYRCQEVGHIARDCGQRRGKGQPTNVKRQQEPQGN